MALSDLPTLYDLTEPASNLAAADMFWPGDQGRWQAANLAGVVPDVIEKNRFLVGQDYVPAYLAGLYGFKRRGRLIDGILLGLVGYMAPLPAAGLIAYDAFVGLPTAPQVSLSGYTYSRSRSRRMRRYRR